MTYRDVLVAMVPVAYWRLGEPGGLFALDEMFTYLGTYVGGPTLGATGLLTGDTNTAMTGDGIDSDVAIPAMGAMASWSIAFWAKANGVSPDFSGYFGTTGDVMDIATFASNHVGFYDGAWTQDVVPFVIGETNFWVVTFASPTLEIYKDGVLAYSAARGRGLTNVSAIIGSIGVGSGFSAATLDEFAIWDRAITQTEVRTLYVTGSTGTAPVVPPSTPGPTHLVMYRGDDRDFTVTVTEGGSPLDLSGFTIRSTFRDDIDASTPTFELDSTVVLGTGFEIDIDPDQADTGRGQLTLHIREADTLGVARGSTLIGDIELTDGAGLVRTVPEADYDQSTLIRLRVRGDVTHA